MNTKKLLLRAVNCLHPPFRKGGRGGFESWENPPESPFAKGGLLRQVKPGCREKSNKGMQTILCSP
jgi:hypothetical protein